MNAFRCDKLCGDGVCCSALRWSLDNFDVGGVPWRSDAERREYPSLAVWEAIIDPAIIAELMAMGLRARGFSCVVVSPETQRWTAPNHLSIRWNASELALYDDGLMTRLFAEAYTLPEARTELLAIMATPADPTSRDECERIVRGTNGV